MLTLLLSACTDPAVGNPQAGEQPPSCGRTESEIALGEPSSLGFATVAVDELAGAYVVPREAAEGCESTTLRFSLYASEGGGPSGELNLVCETERGGETMEGLIQLAVWGEGEFE